MPRIHGVLLEDSCTGSKTWLGRHETGERVGTRAQAQAARRKKCREVYTASSVLEIPGEPSSTRGKSTGHENPCQIGCPR